MIAAVVLAAGLSRRMGRPKMILPWGGTTVIGRVAAVLAGAGVEDVVVVTGGAHAEVQAALRGLPARCVFNPDYANGEMARSLQVGLRALGAPVEALLVALGDQPLLEAEVVRAVLAAFRQRGAALVVPRYQMRRGHPWLVARSLWQPLLSLAAPLTLRDFLNQYASQAFYLAVDTPAVLLDLDTEEDYQRYRPEGTAGG